MKIFVEQFRLGKNMTLTELSKKSGVAASHISNIERGIKMPTIGVLCRIAKALGVPCENLYSCDD